MRKIILYIASSLDHYIARANGDTSWLENEAYQIPGEDFGYTEFLDSVNTTLMGHKTYKTITGFDIPFPYSDKTNYVFTTQPALPSNDQVRFVNGDIVRFCEELKNEPGRDIWLIGGGQINSILLNAGLIDKIILTLIPVILGEGIRLFSGEVHETRFSLEKSKSFRNGFTQLSYIPPGLDKRRTNLK